MRGPDILAAVARQVAVAEIIGEDDEDVRAVSGTGCAGPQQQEGQ